MAQSLANRNNPTQTTDRNEQELANPKRDTGNLEEPLENSVLHYSLRKLQKNVQAEDTLVSGLDLDGDLTNVLFQPVIYETEHGRGNATQSVPLTTDRRQTEQQPLQQGTRTTADTSSMRFLSGQLSNSAAEQQSQPDVFEPSDAIFQSSVASLIPFNMNCVGEDEWFQLDGENSAQGRQTFHRLF